MAAKGGKRITKNMFRFKHHAIPVPKITATNRIINATTRQTTTIASAGIQDSGMVQANVGQKLLKRHILRVFSADQ